MKIKRLKLTSFRIFEQVTFEFQSGMNLLVGINGVGKSSVLDALRMLLSRSLPEFTASRERSIRFTAADFTVGHYGLTGDLHFNEWQFIFCPREAGRCFSGSSSTTSCDRDRRDI